MSGFKFDSKRLQELMSDASQGSALVPSVGAALVPVPSGVKRSHQDMCFASLPGVGMAAGAAALNVGHIRGLVEFSKKDGATNDIYTLRGDGASVALVANHTAIGNPNAVQNQTIMVENHTLRGQIAETHVALQSVTAENTGNKLQVKALTEELKKAQNDATAQQLHLASREHTIFTLREDVKNVWSPMGAIHVKTKAAISELDAAVQAGNMTRVTQLVDELKKLYSD